jgi:hypothetical protein
MNLFELLPLVKRARDFYLYDDKGERILDLYLDDGRAINGHRPGGLSLSLKNAIERGLYAPYPSIYSARLIKLLKNEFPRFQNIGIYRNLFSFREAYRADFQITDPIDNTVGEIQLWRAYLPVGDNCRVLILRFPFPGCEAIAVLSVEDIVIPPSELLPPYVLSGLIRSYYDFKKREGSRDEKTWIQIDRTGHWKRTGPYLRPLCSRDEYENLFKFYLDRGIFISPDYDKPSICAVDIKEGSLKKLFKSTEEAKSGK